MQGKLDYKLKTIISLKRTILDSLVFPGENSDVEAVTNAERSILTDTHTLKCAISKSIKHHKSDNSKAAKQQFTITKTDAYRYKIDGDILKSFVGAEKIGHKILESAILSIFGMEHRLSKMLSLDSISHFSDDDKDLIDSRIHKLITSLTHEKNYDQFSRILSVGKFSNLANIEDGKLNIDKLLELRKSTETLELKEFIKRACTLTDSELNNELKRFQKNLSRGIHSGTGKAIRFLTYTIVSALPDGVGPILGTMLGAVDMFLLEKLIPRYGYLTFLSEDYPSLISAASDTLER
jgi:hypothetical protein